MMRHLTWFITFQMLHEILSEAQGNPLTPGEKEFTLFTSTGWQPNV